MPHLRVFATACGVSAVAAARKSSTSAGGVEMHAGVPALHVIADMGLQKEMLQVCALAVMC